METKSFLKSTISYSLGIFGTKVIMFALVPVYSFFLNKEELGEYDLILVSITLFTPLITVQIADAIYRYLLQTHNEDLRTEIISSGLSLIIKGYVVFGIIAFIVNYFLKYSFFSDFMILLLASCIYLLIQQVLRGLGKGTIYAAMGLANAVLVTGLSLWFLIILEWQLQGLLWALTISQFCSAALGILFGGLRGHFGFGKIRVNVQKALLKYSWPLLPNALSWWLIDLGNRYLILLYLGEEFNGVYAVAARYAGIMALINSIFVLTWQDFAISDGESSKVDLKKVSKIFRYFVGFELGTILVLAAASKYIIQWTTDEKFHEAVEYFPILLMAAGFSAFSAYIGALYLKEKKTIGLFSTSLVGGLSNIIFSVLFIEALGLYAVALGSLLGFTITLLLRLRVYRISIPFISFIILGICYILTLGIQYQNMDIYMAFNFIFAVLIFFIFNKRLFLSIKAKLLN